MGKKIDHRVLMTKMLLRQSFFTLLSQKDFEGITVTELCQEAGINRGTFYAHYQDMDDLLRSIENEIFLSLTEAICAYPPHGGDDEGKSPRTLFEAIYSFFNQYPDMLPLLLGQNVESALLIKIVDAGFPVFHDEYVAVHPHADKEQLQDTYSFVSGGFVALLKSWLQNGRKVDVTDIARKTEQLVTACISAA